MVKSQTQKLRKTKNKNLVSIIATQGLMIVSDHSNPVAKTFLKKNILKIGEIKKRNTKENE